MNNMALRQSDQWSLALLNVDRNKMHIKAHHPEMPKREMERLISLIAATAEAMGRDRWGHSVGQKPEGTERVNKWTGRKTSIG